MKTPTIALCLMAYNDLRMLRVTLPHNMKWADQVCILDMGSTDGTEEYCNDFLRPQDRYTRRPHNTIPKLGFAEARNAAGAMAERDWIFAGASNIIAPPEEMFRLKKTYLLFPDSDALASETRNIRHEPGFEPEKVEYVLKRGLGSGKVDQHRHIYRNRIGSGMHWRGYIHEELYQGEVNAFVFAEPTPLTTFHFENWSNTTERHLRYCYMLRCAIQNPALQEGTNRWWFDTYYPGNREAIEAGAKEYERLRDIGQLT